MWWNTVDISNVHSTIVRPRFCGRSPEWQSTVKLKAVDKEPPKISPISASNVPRGAYLAYATAALQKNMAANKKAALQRQRAAQMADKNSGKQRASSTPATSSVPKRPSSAPSRFGMNTAARSRPSSAASRPSRPGSAPRRPQSAGSNPGNVAARGFRLQRPQSAPTMLRAWDGQREMRQAHEDEFLQMLECYAVKSNVEQLRTERFISKDLVDAVEPLTDSTLHDLKVLHNSAQRALSARSRPTSAGTSRPGSANANRSRPASASNQPQAASNPNGGGIKVNPQKIPEDPALKMIRDVGEKIKTDLHKYCPSLAEMSPRNSTEEEAYEALQEYMELPEDEEARKERQRRELLSHFGGMFSKTKTVLPAEAEGEETTLLLEEATETAPAAPAAPELVAGPPESEEQGPTHVTGVAQRAATQRLGELVGFLLGCCGSIASAFNALDANQDRVMSLEEWEDGIQRLGFQDDVSYVFKLLGKKPDEEATLNEIETLFAPFMKQRPSAETTGGRIKGSPRSIFLKAMVI